jgi:hypothetical protein
MWSGDCCNGGRMRAMSRNRWDFGGVFDVDNGETRATECRLRVTHVDGSVGSEGDEFR